jgi:hypothetical protein
MNEIGQSLEFGAYAWDRQIEADARPKDWVMRWTRRNC